MWAFIRVVAFPVAFKEETGSPESLNDSGEPTPVPTKARTLNKYISVTILNYLIPISSSKLCLKSNKVVDSQKQP